MSYTVTDLKEFFENILSANAELTDETKAQAKQLVDNFVVPFKDLEPYMLQNAIKSTIDSFNSQVQTASKNGPVHFH